MLTNKLTKALMATGFILVGQAHAAVEDVSVSFETIQDVSIALTQAMHFGDDLSLASGSTCTLDVTSVNGPSPLDARIAVASAGGGTYQASDCDSSDDDTGIAGIYTITGAPGVVVNVTVNPITTGTSFNFAPTAVETTYDGSGDGDSLTDLTVTGDTVQLANATDVSGRTVGGLPVAGEARLYVGGTITTVTNLIADSDHTEQFTIDVTY